MANERVIEILKGYKQRLENACSNLLDEDLQAFDFAIKAVEERPQGEWITKNEYTHDCSLCGCSMLDEWNFCPNCGAEMLNNTITECIDMAIDENLPLFFIYYEETGVLEVYVTETKELFEKRHCSKHLPKYKFKEIAFNYLDWYLDWYSDWKGEEE